MYDKLVCFSEGQNTYGISIMYNRFYRFLDVMLSLTPDIPLFSHFINMKVSLPPRAKHWNPALVYRH